MPLNRMGRVDWTCQLRGPNSAGSRPRSTILLLLSVLFSFSSPPSTRRLFWTALSWPVSTEKRKPKEVKSPKPTVSERATGPRRLAAFGVVIQTIARFAFAITVHRISTHGTPVERAPHLKRNLCSTLCSVQRIHCRRLKIRKTALHSFYAPDLERGADSVCLLTASHTSVPHLSRNLCLKKQQKKKLVLRSAYLLSAQE